LELNRAQTFRATKKETHTDTTKPNPTSHEDGVLNYADIVPVRE